jgi:hypothetical protein
VTGKTGGDGVSQIFGRRVETTGVAGTVNQQATNSKDVIPRKIRVFIKGIANLVMT